MMSHLGIKPWQCSLCGYNALAKDKVMRHIKNRHQGAPNGGIINLGVKLEMKVRDFKLPEGEKSQVLYNVEQVTETTEGGATTAEQQGIHDAIVTPEMLESGQIHVTPEMIESGQIQVTPEMIESGQVQITSEMIESGQVQVNTEMIENGQVQVTPEMIESGQVQVTSEMIESGQVQITSDMIENGQVQVTSEMIESGQVQVTSEMIESGKVQIIPEMTETSEDTVTQIILSESDLDNLGQEVHIEQVVEES